MNKFLFENSVIKDGIDTTLFLKKKNDDLLIVQIYIDDIIFDATNEFFCQEFSKLMWGEFEISMMGKLNFFSESKLSKPSRKSSSIKVNTSKK